MKNAKIALLIKYAICFGIASLIAVIVFAMKGFFTNDTSVNIQILIDGFFVSGILFLFAGGLLFVNDEGGLIGIRFVLRNVILTFIPMGRQKHELYAQYRERVLANRKKTKIHTPILLVGTIFTAVAVIMSIVWYNMFGESLVL